MKKIKIITSIVVTFTLCFIALSLQYASANAGQPPAYIIRVENQIPNYELKINNMVGEKMVYEGAVYWTFIETSPGLTTDVLSIEYDGHSSDITLNGSNSYNQFYTLDMSNYHVTVGRGLVFSWSTYAIRLITTLVIEAIVLLIFQFKQRRTWIVFLITNIVTQFIFGFLLANWMFPTGSGYYTRLIFILIAEVAIFIVEAIVYSLALNEKTIWRRIAYAACANLASGILGAWIVTALIQIQNSLLL